MARLNETRTSALLTERVGATFLSSAAARDHAEHSAALLVGVDADAAIEVGGTAITARAVLVAPDTVYRATSAGPLVSFAFDPESCAAVAGLARDGGTRPVTGALGSHVVAAVNAHRASLTRADVLAGVGDELAARLAATAAMAPRRLDRRVAGVVEALRDPTGDGSAAIARTRVSRAHLRDLFVRDVGIAMRSYALWRRLLHALAHVGPLDLTASAHAAGFADLAHFSRTCRRMLGYAPSELQRRLAT